MIDRKAAAKVNATFGFKIGDERYVATVQDGTIEIETGEPDDADVIFTATPEVMAAVIYGGQDIKTMKDSGALQIEGDRRLAARFVKLFPLPNRC